MQKPDGSFGESCDSYEDPNLKGIGESTPSQTAWGAMGLMAVFGADDPGVKRAIDWLIEQSSDPMATGMNTSTPARAFRVCFYLMYHYYRLYFPLTALARYKRLSAN